jgi:hypothetical protein
VSERVSERARGQRERRGEGGTHRNVSSPHLEHDRQAFLAILHGIVVRIQDDGVDLQRRDRDRDEAVR